MSEYNLSLTAEEIDNRLVNAVLFSTQTLTEEQKAQARANIGAISKDEENIITEEVEYHYDGNRDGDRTLIKASTGAIAFVKIAPLPEGELNLIGSRVSAKSSDSYFNANFEITEETLALNADKDGVIIPAVEKYKMTQIFYKRPIDRDLLTYICICERPGTYKIAFEAWYSELYFPETGIYVMDGRDYSRDIYVDYINTSITFKTQNENGGEIISTSPVKYKGNEIQVFNKGICIGDSITEGYFDNDAGNTIIRKYSYPTILSKLTGIDIVNSGVSGFTSKQWYEASIDSTTQSGKWVNGAWVWNLYPQVGDNDRVSDSLDYSEFDFAIIHLGINDTASNTSIEEIISTFNSSINGIISNLKMQSKGIKIFLATIIPYRSPIGNVIYEALNEKIREIANNTEDVYLIDLNIHSECFENTPYGNGYHLTAIGYHKMASEISSLISYTISQNLDDFKNIQFIGTSYTII